MDISTHIGGMVPQNRWQPHQKVKVCQYQDCGASFTFFSSKYNCHRCGIVLCSTCASTTIVIPRHYNNEAVPVCRRCYRVIEHYKAHGPSTPGFVLHSATVSSTPARTSATPLAFATPAPPPRDITHHGATTEPSHTNIPEQNNLASLSSTRVTGTDIHGLQEVIRTLQTALLQEQSKYIAAASANDTQLNSMRDENVALKTALTLLQQQLLETDKPTPQLASSATELQQRLDLATRQRTDLEAQVAQLEADRDEARGQQVASTADLQQRLDLATRQRTDLEAQVAQLEADRDEARGQQVASTADLQQRLDLATRQRTDLEAHVASLTSELQTTKEKLHQAVSKAFAAMTRLSIMNGGTSVEASSLAATSSVTGVAAAVGEKSIYGPVEESPEEDAALVGEVGERLRKRGEAMRLSAEIVELRESTRPLEMVLVEKLAEDHRTSHAEGVVSECTQLPWNVAHARRLDKREALLKEKERLLLGAARDLQAKARALKAVHARAAESPPVKMLRVAADRDDVSKPSTPLLKQCCPRTPLRAPACQLESGVLHHKHTAGVAASNDPASPPPREPPRGPLLPRDVRIRSRSEVETQAADAEGGTHERLVAATEAYRDVLYEHILESNGLQRVDALVQYLPPQIPGCSPRTPQLLPSDVVAKTRAMLRALEKRIFSYRDVMREVDPTLQQRSLEALRRLEAAVGALCGDEEG